MKLYHGTSYENFVSILQNGFGAENTIWNVSDPDVLYCWNPDRLLTSEDCENLAEAQQRAIQRAFESGQISAAFFGSLSNQIVVIEYDADVDDIFEDDSCENMADACYIVEPKVENITAFYTSEYFPDLRLFYMQGVRRNDYFNFEDLPRMTRKALEMLPDDCYLYDLMDSINPIQGDLQAMRGLNTCQHS